MNCCQNGGKDQNRVKRLMEWWSEMLMDDEVVLRLRVRKDVRKELPESRVKLYGRYKARTKAATLLPRFA